MTEQAMQVWFRLLIRGGWNFLFPCGLGSVSFSCFCYRECCTYLSQRYLRSRQILWTTWKCSLAWFYTRLWPQLWLMVSVCRKSPVTLLGYQLICTTFLRSEAFSLKGGIDLVEGISQSSNLLEHRHHRRPVCLGRLNCLKPFDKV